MGFAHKQKSKGNIAMKKVSLAYVFFCIVLLTFVAIYCRYEAKHHSAESETNYYGCTESFEVIDSPELITDWLV